MTHTEGRFDYDTLDGLRVDTALRSFIETQVLPGAGDQPHSSGPV